MFLQVDNQKGNLVLSMSKQNISDGQNRPIDRQFVTSDSKEQDFHIGFSKCMLLNLSIYT